MQQISDRVRQALDPEGRESDRKIREAVRLLKTVMDDFDPEGFTEEEVLIEANAIHADLNLLIARGIVSRLGEGQEYFVTDAGRVFFDAIDEAPEQELIPIEDEQEGN